MASKSVVALLVLPLLVPVAAGSTAEADNGDEESGLVIMVGGVGGWDVLGLSARYALPRAGVAHEIRDFDWTHGWGQWMKDLQDSRHLVRKAQELAELIRVYRAEHPGRPVFLVARSGGTGLVLLAAELLPPGSLERIILLSAAVSPDYDLRGALRATRKEIVSFYSRHDQLILGWGTRNFGTIDRVYGPSAGLGGFELTSDASPEDRVLYARLVEIPWNPCMVLHGHAGRHIGTSAPAFLAAEVAPWLR